MKVLSKKLRSCLILPPLLINSIVDEIKPLASVNLALVKLSRPSIEHNLFKVVSFGHK